MQKVAGNAIPRKSGPTKAEKRLLARRADYSQMISKPRPDNWAGFKRPGAVK